MNLQESRNMKMFVDKFPDAHPVLIAYMGTATTSDELAVPLHAYMLKYPKAEIPLTPMFRSAASIIENAIYNETVAFALSLGVDRQSVDRLAGAPPVRLQPSDVPQPRLTTDYDVTPPSDAARAEAKVLRAKQGTIPSNKVIVKSKERVQRYDQQFPRHWSRPGFGQTA